MMRARLVLFPLGALALSACVPGGKDDGAQDSAPGLGYELAAAGELQFRKAMGQTGSDIAERNPQIVEIDVEALKARIASGDVRVIDVRTDEEVAQGMIPGAEHIPLDRFAPAELDPADGRDVVLYCRSGRRSALAAEVLAGHTGEPVEHLAGGILAWEAAGEEVE